MKSLVFLAVSASLRRASSIQTWDQHQVEQVRRVICWLPGFDAGRKHSWGLYITAPHCEVLVRCSVKGQMLTVLVCKNCTAGACNTCVVDVLSTREM